MNNIIEQFLAETFTPKQARDFMVEAKDAMKEGFLSVEEYYFVVKQVMSAITGIQDQTEH
jgi:hypothetical protein